jgi:transposase-like protein
VARWRPFTERRQEQKKLSGLIGIELPAQEFEPVQPPDKAPIQQRVQHAQAQLQELAATLNQKGYPQAATYVEAARRRLFSYIEFWMETGVAAWRTTSYLERLMRELGRRLKRMAFGWSESGAAKMARILIKRICDPDQWTAYWKHKLRIAGNVLISFRGAKVVSL